MFLNQHDLINIINIVERGLSWWRPLFTELNIASIKCGRNWRGGGFGSSCEELPLSQASSQRSAGWRIADPANPKSTPAPRGGREMITLYEGCFEWKSMSQTVWGTVLNRLISEDICCLQEYIIGPFVHSCRISLFKCMIPRICYSASVKLGLICIK